jgi:hypothetical protein
VHPSAADGACPSQAPAAGRARHRPFAAGPAGILRLQCLRGFPLPGRLEGLRRRLGPDGERAPGGARLRADALGDVVAAPAIAARARHLEDRIPAILKSRRPTETGLAGGTGRVLLAPRNLKVWGIKAMPGPGLPVRVETGGPQEVHAIVLQTLDPPLGVQQAGVHARAAGQPVPLRQRRVALGCGGAIGRWADGGLDRRAQGREVIGTGLRALPFVAHPWGRVLARIVGVRIIGRAEALCGRRNGVGLAPVQRGAVPPLVLAPDPAQEGDSGDLAQPGRGLGVLEGGPSAPAIMPTGQRQRGTGRLWTWEPIILRASRLAVPPIGMAHGTSPRRSDDGARVQPMPQRCADALEAVQRPHRRQTRRGVHPLPPPRLDELPVTAPRAPRVTPAGLRRPGQPAAATCAEDRRIAPGVRAFQAQDVVPSETAAYRVPCVAIRPPCSAWQDRHARELPGGVGRLSVPGQARPKGVIRAPRRQRIGSPPVLVPLGTRGAGDTRRFRGDRLHWPWAKQGTPPRLFMKSSPCRWIVSRLARLRQQYHIW